MDAGRAQCVVTGYRDVLQEGLSHPLLKFSGGSGDDRPVSRSAWRTQWRSVSAVHPIFSATDRIAAHCDSCWCSWSNTNRTARSRTSGEYFLGLPMDSILPNNGASRKPGAVQCECPEIGVRPRIRYAVNRIDEEYFDGENL